uniref:Uncharacterized protein n=1 Tax=Scleropages formosus TaxID=113540 RepID=A0A8C9V830_SCLFO
METVQEILPFAREMLGQGANRRMFRVYFVGAAVAVLGTSHWKQRAQNGINVVHLLPALQN